MNRLLQRRLPGCLLWVCLLIPVCDTLRNPFWSNILQPFVGQALQRHLGNQHAQRLWKGLLRHFTGPHLFQVAGQRLAQDHRPLVRTPAVSTGHHSREVKVDQLVRHQSGLDAGLYGDGQHALEQLDPQPLAEGVQRTVIRPRPKQAEPAEPAPNDVLPYPAQQGRFVWHSLQKHQHQQRHHCL